jgi:uncharacterized damage-inducible protein DinB
MTADLFQLLELDRRALVAAVEQVPSDKRDQRPGPDIWSVAEILEHLGTVERSVTKLLVVRGQQPPSESQAVAEPLEAAQIDRLRGRSARIEAPERVRPRGTVTAADALATLSATRAALCEAVSAAHPAALAGCTHPHPVLGTITLIDWIRFVAHHEARHAGQVREIAGALTA